MVRSSTVQSTMSVLFALLIRSSLNVTIQHLFCPKIKRKGAQIMTATPFVTDSNSLILLDAIVMFKGFFQIGYPPFG